MQSTTVSCRLQDCPDVTRLVSQPTAAIHCSLVSLSPITAVRPHCSLFLSDGLIVCRHINTVTVCLTDWSVFARGIRRCVTETKVKVKHNFLFNRNRRVFVMFLLVCILKRIIDRMLKCRIIA